MRPFPLIMITLLVALYGLAWHDKPARHLAPTRDASPINWETFTIWILVAISFATFFLGGYLIWAKCDGK